jgi:hypothetical protein
VVKLRKGKIMTPQQYDRINGLNALGGCMCAVCIFGAMPVGSVLTGSVGAGIGIGLVLVVVGTLWINKMKADV